MKFHGALGQYLNGISMTGLGKLVGNEELPEAAQVVNYRKGSGGMWGDVILWGVKIGYLKPGGKNGIFVREQPNPPDPTLASGATPATNQPSVSATPPAPIPITNTTGPTPVTPVIIPYVQGGGSSAVNPGNPATSYIETPGASSLAPIQDEATASGEFDTGKLIGLAALGLAGYFAWKAFK